MLVLRLTDDGVCLEDRDRGNNVKISASLQSAQQISESKHLDHTWGAVWDDGGANMAPHESATMFPYSSLRLPFGFRARDSMNHSGVMLNFHRRPDLMPKVWGDHLSEVWGSSGGRGDGLDRPAGPPDLASLFVDAGPGVGAEGPSRRGFLRVRPGLQSST